MGLLTRERRRRGRERQRQRQIREGEGTGKKERERWQEIQINYNTESAELDIVERELVASFVPGQGEGEKLLKIERRNQPDFYQTLWSTCWIRICGAPINLSESESSPT